MKNEKSTIVEQLMAMADATKAIGNLSDMNLTGTNLSGMNLTNAIGDLRDTNLTGTNLKGADLDLPMPTLPILSSWGWLMLWRRNWTAK